MDIGTCDLLEGWMEGPVGGNKGEKTRRLMTAWGVRRVINDRTMKPSATNRRNQAKMTSDKREAFVGPRDRVAGGPMPRGMSRSFAGQCLWKCR